MPIVQYKVQIIPMSHTSGNSKILITNFTCIYPSILVQKPLLNPLPKMQHVFLTLTLTAVLTLRGIDARSNGAPDAVCTNGLKPQHGKGKNDCLWWINHDCIYCYAY